MRANVQRPFPHQAGKIPTPAHFRGNFAARQDSPPVSSTSPHPRRAAPGKTSRPVRLPLYQPPLLHPRRAISGEISQACQTARPSAQPNLTRTGVFRGKLRRDENCAPSDRPLAAQPHRAHAGLFQGKFHRHVRLPARQPNPISPAQGCSGENFTGTKVALRQTRQQSVRQPPPPHPRRVISGETSRPVRTARLSAQPHRIRAELLQGKLHKPKTTAQQTAQRSPPVQPFWSNFAARWTAQRSFIRPSAPAKLLTYESARPTLARPNRNAPHAAPSDSATMSSA